LSLTSCHAVDDLFCNGAGCDWTKEEWTRVQMLSPLPPVPDDFTIHFVSHSDDWRFLKYSEFIINYDGIKKDFGELKVDGEVLADARVLEQMMAHVGYDTFHQMAFARNVRMNLGTQMNDTITPESRIKWQILCNYFDLIKAEQQAKTKNSEAIEPAPKP